MKKLLALLWLVLSIVGAQAQSISQPGGGSSGLTAGTTTVTGCTALNLFYDNTGALGCMGGTSWDNTNRSLTISGATLTGASAPIISGAQTWNNGATAFTGLLFEITNTASAAGSKAFDVKVDGTSFFNVASSSVTTALTLVASTAITSPTHYFNAGSTAVITGPSAATFSLGGPDLAAPIAQTLGVSNVLAGTADTAGALWAQKGSAGTGTGVGGNIKWQVALAGGAGSAQNSFTDALTLEASAEVPRITAGGPIKRKGYAVASLPTGSEGDEAYVTDQLTACPALGGTFTGGGAVKCSAFFDGSSWTHQ